MRADDVSLFSAAGTFPPPPLLTPRLNGASIIFSHRTTVTVRSRRKCSCSMNRAQRRDVLIKLSDYSPSRDIRLSGFHLFAPSRARMLSIRAEATRKRQVQSVRFWIRGNAKTEDRARPRDLLDHRKAAKSRIGTRPRRAFSTRCEEGTILPGGDGAGGLPPKASLVRKKKGGERRRSNSGLCVVSRSRRESGSRTPREQDARRRRRRRPTQVGQLDGRARARSTSV